LSCRFKACPNRHKQRAGPSIATRCVALDRAHSRADALCAVFGRFALPPVTPVKSCHRFRSSRLREISSLYNGDAFAMRAAMRKLILLLLFAIPNGMAAGQAPQAGDKRIVEEVTVEGVPAEQMSAALREDLQKLVGQPYDPQSADQFSNRIQMELPEFVAASRVLPGAQPDRVRLVFAVARITDK